MGWFPYQELLHEPSGLEYLVIAGLKFTLLIEDSDDKNIEDFPGLYRQFQIIQPNSNVSFIHIF